MSLPVGAAESRSRAHLSRTEPRATLSVFDAVTILVGLVVGIGIFRTPSIVAGSVSSEWMFVLVWVAGGAVTLVGALCYAELSAAHPHMGGEYHFLSRAYGQPVAMLFGWARCTVIQTGAIAAVAFMLGDYLAQLVPLGPHGPALYAALSVIVLTAVNVVGTTEGKNLQIVVTFLQLAVIMAIIAFGMLGPVQPASSTAPVAVSPGTAALGMAMIFVLLTYGGWNEAAYLTGELRDAPRNIARVLAIGTLVVVCVYVLTNLALLSVLGLDGLRASNAVAADMMRATAGPSAETVVILAIALMLIALGTFTQDGFKAMVDYTAPVFWAFMLLVGGALFVLRWRCPQHERPYRVPAYPFTPTVFCLTCAYMLYASIRYTGSAGWVGLAVLASGVPLLLFRRPHGAGDPASPAARSCPPS